MSTNWILSCDTWTYYFLSALTNVSKPPKQRNWVKFRAWWKENCQFTQWQKFKEKREKTAKTVTTKNSQTISHNYIKIIGQKHENAKSTQFYQPICIRTSIGSSNTTVSYL